MYRIHGSSRYGVATISSIVGNEEITTSRDSTTTNGAAHTINNANRNSERERGGFRRLARSLWSDFSSKKSLGGHVSSNNTNALVADSSSILLDPITFENYTYRRYHHHRNPDTEFNPWKSDYADKFDRDDNKQLELGFDLSRLDFQLSRHLVSRSNDILVPVPPPTREKPRTVVKTTFSESKESLHEVKPVAFFHSTQSHLMKKQAHLGKRVLVLRNVSLFVGLKSVLAQVCGGPLQKVVVQRSSSSDLEPHQYKRYSSPQVTKHLSIELWFLKAEHAHEFHNYTKSGLFLVNGFHHYVQWAPQHHAGTSSEKFHESVPRDVEELMLEHDATRILVLKKYVRKIKTSGRRYPSPTDHFSPLDVTKIKRDFSQFGDIIEVSPMVSKKLCVAVHFYDVECAVGAKQLLENADDEFSALYREWSVLYGKDTTDKPTINVN